ncbi:hypothetical protein [Sandaracinus amylolyticus]|uniref:hypothetical protein n=1 Tax=Sandaracinus amylolyticus TaxID=927083 RepID=UPI001F34A5C5|nr:hypothetical protein [Sandaracinus amylolyticus]UJR85608.1 Hypothetical protein I5071_76880 [Sandaracinus amylolyticus]
MRLRLLPLEGPFVALVALCLTSACDDPSPSRPTRDSGPGVVDAGGGDASTGIDGGVPTGPCAGPDTDGDGIPDAFESTVDSDGDGTPNSMDDDSDGDGVLDSVERRDACPPRDSDRDTIPDYLDADSDNDGLTDAEERELGTDATRVDTDGDGVSDLGEVRGSGTSPTDATSTIPEDDFFVILPYEGDHEMRPLRFGTAIARADVYFLIDTTGSMQDAIDDVNSSLMRIATEVARLVPDAQFGVGHYDDFPVDPYGGTSEPTPIFYVDGFGDPISCTRDSQCPGLTSVCDTRDGRCVEPCTSTARCATLSAGSTCPSTAPRYCSIALARDDAPYTHDIDITGDLARVNAALALTVNGGADIPESGTEAIYLAATGMGLTYPNDRTGTSTIAAKTCAPVAGETEARRGYPCFRPGALPIVVTVTDAPFHNGTTTNASWSVPYAGPVATSAHSFAQAVTALNDLGARAIGVNVGTGTGGTAAGTDLRALAMQTGTVSSTGMPLVYTGAASTTANQIIEGIRSVVSGTPQDVSTRTANVAGNPDEFDATTFIKSIVPLEGYGPGGVSGAMPGVTYSSRDATTFYGVIPGTEVEFTVDFWNDVRMPAATAQIFRARIIVVGNGVADLDERQVYIVVPPEGGDIVLE